jgi:hypothetical protein
MSFHYCPFIRPKVATLDWTIKYLSNLPPNTYHHYISQKLRIFRSPLFFFGKFDLKNLGPIDITLGAVIHVSSVLGAGTIKK